MSSLPTCAPEEVGLSSARLATFGRVLADRVAAGHIPGAVALIARHGRIAWHQAFGRRDPAAADPMQGDSLFRIYSMTKPMVSVGIMMLAEEGRLLLEDPIGTYIPALAGLQVARPEGGLEPAAKPITVQDLLRHTSGLIYEFRGTGPVHQAYREARIDRRKQSNADQVETLSGLPLLHQPGTRWDYSRATDVLGRLIEVISGQTLGEFLAARLTGPLGMADTGFHVPQAKHHRLAEGFPKDPETGAEMSLLAVREPVQFESGGGGLMGTAPDYARFAQMLLNGGRLRDTRILSRKTVEWMVSDHLGSIPRPADLVPPGHGFGLGFCVRTAPGMAGVPGSVGNFFWHGMAGTTFWVDPAEDLVVVFMMQAIGQRGHYRALVRDLAYAAIAD
jgi:CubicO group peptidase (beta-lactamase class C family)